MSDIRAALTRLAAQLADPAEELVIAGEGNLSGSLPDGTLLVSPSGFRLAAIAPEDWVAIDGAGLTAGLAAGLDDGAWLDRILASRLDASAPRPTVEVALHAAIASELGADAAFIAHTHPTALLSILCAPGLEDYARSRFFPDHIVALGTADCVIPYIDPGQELARATLDAVRGHRDRFGESPRVILAANHGVFVTGSTPQETLDRTRMAVKVARVALNAASRGGPVALAASQVARIAGREDEHFRRALLAGA